MVDVLEAVVIINDPVVLHGEAAIMIVVILGNKMVLHVVASLCVFFVWDGHVVGFMSIDLIF